jgi:hypothetical protein
MGNSSSLTLNVNIFFASFTPFFYDGFPVDGLPLSEDLTADGA